MSLINKIKDSVENCLNITCLYDSSGDINRRLDYIDYPAAFFTLINRGNLNTTNNIYREVANVVIFFVKTSQFDFESLENEAIIQECKTLALTWFDSLKRNGVLRAFILDTTRVYNYGDTILTGYALNVRIEELEGEDCLNPLIPDERKKTIVFNVDAGGSINRESGIYIVDYKLSVEASPNPGYEFKGWYDGEELLSLDPVYMFTVEDDITIDVKFEKIPLIINTQITLLYPSVENFTLTNADNETYLLELEDGENKYYGDVEGFDILEITNFTKEHIGPSPEQNTLYIDAHGLTNWTEVTVGAFYGCMELVTLILPNSIQSIDHNGIRECLHLENLICLSETPPILGTQAFSGNSRMTIYVPADSVDAYKTAWSDFADRIQAITE